MDVSMLSALVRNGQDPWYEVARLAAIPPNRATESLAVLITRLPLAIDFRSDANAIARRLVPLLTVRPGVPVRIVDTPTGTPKQRAFVAVAGIIPAVALLALMVASTVPAGLVEVGVNAMRQRTVAASLREPSAHRRLKTSFDASGYPAQLVDTMTVSMTWVTLFEHMLSVSVAWARLTITPFVSPTRSASPPAGFGGSTFSMMPATMVMPSSTCPIGRVVGAFLLSGLTSNGRAPSPHVAAHTRELS